MQAMVLMILIALYGYLRPYSWNASNILEVAVLVDFLIMLLIRDDPAIVEPYSLFSPSNVSSLAEFANCHDDQEMAPFHITTLTKILTVFYYTPVLFSLVTILVVIFLAAIRKFAPGFYSRQVIWQPEKNAPWQDVSNLNLSLTDIQEPLIPTTIVQLRESEH